MDVAAKYKGNYCMNFKDKSGRTVNCKMSCIPVKLCEFPSKELTLVVVYGFGAEPMLLLSNLKMQESRIISSTIRFGMMGNIWTERLTKSMEKSDLGATTPADYVNAIE